MGFAAKVERDGNEAVPKVAVRRERVTDAARALFLERGFHATGMAEISARSGIKVGQIYRDFASKEEIVAEIVRADLASFLDEAALRAAIVQQDVHAVRGWLMGLPRCGEVPAERRLLPEILAEAVRNPTVAQLFQAADDTIRVAISVALEALAPGREKAERRRMLANLILTLMIGASHRVLLAPEEERLATAEQFAALIGREIDALIA